MSEPKLKTIEISIPVLFRVEFEDGYEGDIYDAEGIAADAAVEAAEQYGAFCTSIDHNVGRESVKTTVGEYKLKVSWP